MKQRILHVIDTLDRGGTAKQLCLLASGLPQDEFETHVVVLDRGGSLGDMLSRASIPVHVIGRRWSADPLAFWQLLRHVKEVRPDAIVGWQAAGRAYAAAVAQRCGVRCLVAVWNDIEPWAWPLQRTIDCYIVRRAHVVATSPVARDFCLAQGISPNKIQIVPCGISKATSPVATRGQLLDRLGLPQSARLIGWAGKLSADRGVKDAIWAADLLKVIRDDAHLLICGTGLQRDRLIRYRDQVEIGDKVHFLGDGDLDDVLPHLDQFWSTRRRAGQSQAVLEALAAGLPVVATDLPGTRELIEHEVTGYLVAPGHRAGFARWAEHLLNHSDAARRIGAAGRERVEKDFSMEKMIQAWRALLRQEMGSPNYDAGPNSATSAAACSSV